MLTHANYTVGPTAIGERATVRRAVAKRVPDMGALDFLSLKSLIAKDLRNGPLDQINGPFWKARLVGSHPQQVQAVGMPGVQCQDM